MAEAPPWGSDKIFSPFSLFYRRFQTAPGNTPVSVWKQNMRTQTRSATSAFPHNANIQPILLTGVVQSYEITNTPIVHSFSWLDFLWPLIIITIIYLIFLAEFVILLTNFTSKVQTTNGWINSPSWNLLEFTELTENVHNDSGLRLSVHIRKVVHLTGVDSGIWFLHVTYCYWGVSGRAGRRGRLKPALIRLCNNLLSWLIVIHLKETQNVRYRYTVDIQWYIHTGVVLNATKTYLLMDILFGLCSLGCL